MKVASTMDADRFLYSYEPNKRKTLVNVHDKRTLSETLNFVRDYCRKENESGGDIGVDFVFDFELYSFLNKLPASAGNYFSKRQIAFADYIADTLEQVIMEGKITTKHWATFEKLADCFDKDKVTKSDVMVVKEYFPSIAEGLAAIMTEF